MMGEAFARTVEREREVTLFDAMLADGIEDFRAMLAWIGEFANELRARDGARGAYHTAAELPHAMSPAFRLHRLVGTGVFVPPSAAEPWISEHPSLVRALEAMDRVVGRALAPLGDHVLYWFERTTELHHVD